MNKPFKILIVAAAAPLCLLQAQDTSTPSSSGPPDLRRLLQEALFEEEGTRDLEKAAQRYEALLAGYRDQKQLAATALFRLAEVRRKQGRNRDAIPLYQQLLSDFPAIEPLVKMSRENLAALGAKVAPGTAPPEATADADALSDAEQKELQRLTALAESSPDLLHAPPAGNPPPLESAAWEGYVAVATFLIEHGGVLNPPQQEGPLYKAAAAGHKAMCELLLDKGADVNHRVPGGPTPLHGAVANNRTAVAKLLLERGADASVVSTQPVRAPATVQNLWLANRTSLGTPLLIAAYADAKEMANMLLDHKADVRIAIPDSGLTALHFAAARGDVALVKRLLELGADPRAATTDHLDDQKKVPGGVTPLHFATTAGSTESVKMLLAANVSVNAKGGPASVTALHLAHLEIARLLVDAHADVNATDIQESTPLHMAIRAPSASDLCRLLIDAGADVNAREKGGTTPLWHAIGVAEQYNPLIALLIERGADPEATVSRHPVLLANEKPSVRVPLVRKVRYPNFAEELAITLSFPEWGLSWELARKGDEPPKLSEALLGWSPAPSLYATVSPVWTTPTLFRRRTDGSFEQIRIDLLGEGDLPSLKWGDIVEVTSSNPGSSDDFSQSGDRDWKLPRDVRAALTSRLSRTVTVQIGNEKHTLTLLGRLKTYEPHKNEAPLTTLGPLLRLLGAEQPHFATSSATVRRSKAKGGGVMRVAVSISRSRDTPTTPSPGDGITLEEGDVIEVAPGDEKEFVEVRRSYVTLIAPGLPASWRIPVKPLRGPPAADGGFFAYSEPTLLQLLASHYAPIPPQPLREALGDAQLAVENLESDQLARAVRIADVPARLIISHPDWAAVRIRRLNDDGSEEVIPIDLAAAASKGDTAGDMQLRGGDIVELPVQPRDEPWTGFDETMKTFFSKALSCRITLLRDGNFQEVSVEYVPPRFVSTSAGLIPVPSLPLKDGRVSELHAGALAGSMRLPWEWKSFVRAEAGEFKPISTIFLVGGDRLETSQGSSGTLQPSRRRVTLPPPTQ